MGAVSAWQLVFCAITIIGAFTVRGATGFGGGALATPLLALVLPVQLVIPVVTVLNFVASVEHGIRHRRAICWPEVFFTFPFTAAGLGLGLYLLTALHSDVLRKGLGAFVILYALFAFATAASPMRAPRLVLRPIGAVLSFAAALVGTLFGAAAGPLYAIYYSNLELERTALRVTITVSLLILAGMRITGYAGLGLYDRATLIVLGVALPFMWLGARVADRITASISAPAFNRIVGATLLVSGAVLLVK